MYAFVIIVHVIACIILIASILLQSGRGAGLSDLFGGGGSSQTLFGTRASTFLVRATAIAAISFLLTCILLTVLSSQKMSSLMGRKPLTIMEGLSEVAVPENDVDARVTEKEALAVEDTTEKAAEKTQGQIPQE